MSQLIEERSLVDCIAELVDRRSHTLDICKAILAADEQKIFTVDLLALAAAKRCVSTSKAIQTLVLDRNLLCSRMLLRTHLDTAMRFAAATLVDDPHDFSMRVLSGSRIDKMRRSDGKGMKDADLVQYFAPQLPWLPMVYSFLCSYVHFSSSHMHAVVKRKPSAHGDFSIAVSPVDEDFPESSWCEIISCFNATTDFVHSYLDGWRATKAGATLPEL